MWDKRLTTLDEMLDFAEFYEGKKSLNPTTSTRRGLRVAEGEGEDPEMKKLREQLDQIQLVLKELQAEKKQSPVQNEARLDSPRRNTQQGRPQKKFHCWNCGNVGHLRRNCRQEQIGDGYSFRRVRRQQHESTPEDSLNC